MTGPIRRIPTIGQARYSPIDASTSREPAGAPSALPQAGVSSELTSRREALPLSPPLTAKFGCEIEVGGVRVSAPEGASPPRRGTVLLERPLWKLETDNVPDGHDLEVVFKPLSGEQQVEAAMREIVGLFRRLREQALASDDRTVALRAIASDAKGDYRLAVHDVGLSATLQATCGVRLQDLDQAIQDILPNRAPKVRADTEAVEKAYEQAHGSALPPGARQFISLVNLYVACAQQQKLGGRTSTAHADFRMMSRSDFCAIHDRLLGPADREAVKAVLTASAEQPLPLFMRSQGMHDATKPVFANGYNLQNRSEGRHPGPTLKEWLQSIIDGRGEGVYKKDLLSPPVGYALHTGDLSKDYSMGAMGVDEAQGHLLVELRGAPYRPRNIPMNGQIVRAVRNELGRAAALNPGLEVKTPGAVHSAKFKVLNDADTVLRELRNLTAGAQAQLARTGEAGGRFFQKAMRSGIQRLGDLDNTLSQRTKSDWAPALRAVIDQLRALGAVVLDATAVGASNQDLGDRLQEFSRTLATFERCLWEAGGKRSWE